MWHSKLYNLASSKLQSVVVHLDIAIVLRLLRLYYILIKENALWCKIIFVGAMVIDQVTVADVGDEGSWLKTC
jgi:hypothetical protein